VAIAPETDAALRRRAVVNTVTNVGGTVFTLATGFVLTPFVLHRVGATDYGLWMLAVSLVGYGALLDFGVANAVTRYVAAYRRYEDHHRLRGVVATGLAVFLVAGTIMIVASVVLALALPSLFRIPAGEESTARWLVVLSGLGVAVSLPTATTLAVLRGLQRFDLVNAVSVAGTALNAAVVVAILELGGGVVAVVAANLPLQLAMQVPMVLAIRHSAPELKLGLRGASREHGRAVASFGAAQFAIAVGAQARSRAPEAVIGAVLPATRLTAYSIARRLGEMPYTLSDQFVTVLMPLASSLHAGNERARLRAVQIASTRVALGITLLVGVPVAVLAGPFLAAWVGPEYAGNAKLVWILAGAGVAAIVGWPSGAILTGMGRNRVLALFTASSAVLSIGLTIALLGPLGLTGAALGVLIGIAAETFGLAVPYALRVTGTSLRAFAGGAVAPAVLPALPALTLLLSLREALAPASLAAIAGVGLVGAAAYAVCYLSLPWTAPEREPVRVLLSRCVRPGWTQAARARPTVDRSRSA
jgi:O-antigen/teichoic acid export membrane protein